MPKELCEATSANSDLKINDIVQITNPEVKSFGCQGFMVIVKSNDDRPNSPAVIGHS